MRHPASLSMAFVNADGYDAVLAVLAVLIEAGVAAGQPFDADVVARS
jgi:hypothetical protein